MKSFDGYLKLKLGNDYVLLAGGSHRHINDFMLPLNTSPAATISTGAGSWSPLTGRYVFRQKWTDSSTGSDTADFGIFLDGNLTANMVLDGYYFTLSGYKVSGKDNNSVLLAGGGTKAWSDFAASSHNHDGRYHLNNGGWKSSTLDSYTYLCGWFAQSSNGSGAYAGLCHKDGNMVVYTDGLFYQREGAYYCLDNGNTYISSGTGVINGSTITQVSNSDTVDNEHASAFAHIGAHNNLTASGNEFTFASSGFSGGIWINYRTAGGTNGNITEYYFGNGKGGSLGTAIHSGNFNTWCAAKSHIHSVNELTWAGGVNLTPTASGNGQEWSIDLNPGSYTGCYWHVWSTKLGASILSCYPDDSRVVIRLDCYARNYYTTSDARKKQNIHKISDNIKQFEWKETGETSYGFVAQDLEVKHPELVNDDGNMKTVNYNAALSLVVAKLENRVKELEAKLGLETPPLYLISKLPSFAVSKTAESSFYGVERRAA